MRCLNVQVVGSLAHDLHASGAMASPEFAEARQKMMAGILHLRSGKNGKNWRREDDDLMFELKGHVHEALPLKSIMTLARSIPLDQTNLADVDLTQIHGRLNVKSAVIRYVDPSEATVVIENAGISGLFSPAELRRFRGDKLEADLGM